MAFDTDHVLLTRFNLPSTGVESFIRARDGWLRDRIELFERYCLPSVMAQTTKDFSWIIYFDPQSPEWLKRRIAKHPRCYTPVFRETVVVNDVVEDARRITGASGRRLLTSNLDNDDGLATDFVERLQNAVPTRDRVSIYLSRGLIRHQGTVYLRVDKSNAFVSVAEDWSRAVTCWSDWHTLLRKRMPTLTLGGQPAWLQVVHGNNVSNRVRGGLADPAKYRALFGDLLADVPAPLRRELAVDLAAGRPWRLVRDCSRSLVKEALMRTLGKEGLDRVKETWGTRKF